MPLYWGYTNDFNKEWDGGKEPVNYLITEECNTMNINSVWYNVIKKSLRSIVEGFIIKIIYRLNAKL